METLAFLLPGPLDTPTGGFVYDRKIVDGLSARGWSVEPIIIDGTFPALEPETVGAVLARTDAALTNLPDGTCVLVDGLAFAPLRDGIEPHAQRLSLFALIHHPLCDETGLSAEDQQVWQTLEASALRLARHVVVTSGTTGGRVRSLFGVRKEDLSVVPPGVDGARDLSFRDTERSPGPLRLLSVGTLIPRKGHDVLIAALAGLTEFPWQLEIIGEARDAAHAEALRTLIQSHGLVDRIALRGAVDQSELETAWERADLFVLASRHEGFGMVYQEAVQWGLPIIGTRAGAIPEAAPASASVLVEPESVGALTKTLDLLLSNEGERARLQVGAIREAATLRTWDTVGAEFDTVLRRVGA